MNDRSRSQLVVAGAAGLLFGAGLVLAGMVRADKVLGFLDVLGGAWDPSLAFVMVGAIGVHALVFRFVVRMPSPLFASRFHLPTRRDVDGRLVAGAALFGVGWGLGGVCPGPALAGVASLTPSFLLFAAAMLVGMALFRVLHGNGAPSARDPDA